MGVTHARMPTRSACYGLRFASVLCCAPHRATARPPHASRKLLADQSHLYKV
ncbi:MAG: hypothetical protein NZ455_10255 [Bacteroidia bacterium]|nr:hypothetical protein [Bacteroidia bacterium]MDW8348292.1 hypothetical protein [Bacteroidia bacterium]